jgi:hypothetical protein
MAEVGTLAEDRERQAAAAQARLERLGTTADPGSVVKKESLVEGDPLAWAFIAPVAP